MLFQNFALFSFHKAINLLEGLIPTKDEHDHDHQVLSAGHLEKLFIFSLMWSLGSLLELDDRAKMQDFMLSHESKLNYPDLPEGSGFTIFEFVVTDAGAVGILFLFSSFLL